MSDPTHPSRFKIDSLVAGNISSEEASRISEHLEGCESCRRAHDDVREAHAHFSNSVFRRTVGGVEQRIRRRSLILRWPVWGLTPALVAATLVLVLVHPQLEEPTLQIKGQANLRVFARRGEEVFPVENGTTLAAGDRVRFVVEPADLEYLLLVGVDGDGNASVFYPYQGKESARLSVSREGTTDIREPVLELPGSVVLDSARGPERLFAIFSREPVPSADVLDNLRAIAAADPDSIRTTAHLDLAATVQESIWWEKSQP
ncbi:MAG: hypothetical protein A2289_03545 [Deltaproteobacteria bacterium RIFOXYA12_FULL_58_15]|nr:MAG: hypothetical protein A2289_03545 [Deltaproteobacteria bacterium RIFOXYA12_FULL_58_15]